jgi:hypothetical protein
MRFCGLKRSLETERNPARFWIQSVGKLYTFPEVKLIQLCGSDAVSCSLFPDETSAQTDRRQRAAPMG